ncbi:MAG: hypothetical protein R2939_01070 [Kofleriaceae bacterium]
MVRVGSVLACVLGAGCSIVFDTDDLPRVDAPIIDATPADAAPDADPTALDVTGVVPATALEGTGADGGRPLVALVSGSNIAGDVVVTAAFTDGAHETLDLVEAPVRAAGGNQVALALRLPVDDTCASGTRTVAITLAQAGVSDTATIEVTCLPELTLAAGDVEVASLSPRYSRIEVTGAVHFNGSTPAILRATAGVTLGALLDVDAAGVTAGVHGCGGGAATANGGCGDSGGRGGADGTLAGADAQSGGGGGFGTPGQDGDGAARGAASGNAMLVPLVSVDVNQPGNRGNGGGGGGAGALTGAGGTGGGGGGSLAIFAGGRVTLAGGGLRATGAAGTSGGAAGGAGGGGGSGGAILLRAGGGVLDATGAWMSAAGGSGGDSSPNGVGDGGDGGLGRIRLDAPGAVDLTAVTTPPPQRGPMWDTATPLVARGGSLTTTLFGGTNSAYGIRVDGSNALDVTFTSNPMEALTVPLMPGRHEVCAMYTANAMVTTSGLDETQACIDVIAIP